MHVSLLADAIAQFNRRGGPRVGDFVVMGDGEYRRFAYDWGEEMQTARPDSAEFFLKGDGHMDFAGGLDLSIPKTSLISTSEVRPGACRVSDNDVLLDCRVYCEQAAISLLDLIKSIARS